MEITPEQAISAYEETGLKPGTKIAGCAVKAVYMQIHNLKADKNGRCPRWLRGTEVYNFINSLYGESYGINFGLSFDYALESHRPIHSFPATDDPAMKHGYLVGKAVKEYFKKKTQTPDTELTPQKKEELVSSVV